MAYYKHHVFFCTNQRADGRASCEDHDAREMRDYLKKKVKEAGLAGPGGVRINNAGCLGRCEQGPVLVIYPEEVWYAYKTKKDIDDVFQEYFMGNRKIKLPTI